MSETIKKEFAEVLADQIPEWLNNKFFDEILRKVHKKNFDDDFALKIVSVKPAVGVGENFIASLFRVVVEAEDRQHSFIVKFSNGSWEVAVVYPAFKKEMAIYEDIIPAFEELYRAAGEEVQFGPKCHLAVKGAVEILVFDDLHALGYSIQDRLIGMNLEQSKLLLTKLAKFHAASVVYHADHKDLEDRFKSPFVDVHANVTKDWVDGSLKFFLELLRGNEILHPLVDKIAKWEHSAVKTLARILTADPNHFNVLNHGDFWINNYLFKSTDDVLLIDYQICYWGTPTIDLLYFFISSTDNEICVTQFDNLVQLYHTELVANCRKLGHRAKVPSLKELHIDLLRNGFWAAYNSFMSMSLVLLDARADANMQNIFSTTEEGIPLKKAIFENPRYIRRLEKMLPFLAGRGLLDVDG